jgi:hypothetical protein
VSWFSARLRSCNVITALSTSSPATALWPFLERPSLWKITRYVLALRLWKSRRNPDAWRMGSNAATVSHCNCESASIRVRWSPGEIGCGGLGYTTIGEQVGMAQRMESVAPPGGVMLSESTARLVESATELGEPELVHIKGSDTPVAARRLFGVSDHASRRHQSTLVGRNGEINTITGILDEAARGRGCVVTIVGPPGLGKSRLVGESTAIAAGQGVSVFTAYCESHSSDVPFYVVARLLRARFGVTGLDSQAARTWVRSQVPHADQEDLLSLDDLMGVADPAVALPDIAPAARRRRLTALINGVSLAGATPAVFVIEDVPARSTSRPSCRACPPASSTSDCCATATGRDTTPSGPRIGR